MVAYIRNNIFFRLTWGLLSLYLLNISIDVSPGLSLPISANTTFNDQESIVELFLEKMLGFENAIAEYDDPDTEDQHKKSNTTIDLIILYRDFRATVHKFCDDREPNFQHYIMRATKKYCKIISPPPEA